MSDLTNFVKDNVGDSISKESTTNTNGQLKERFPEMLLKMKVPLTVYTVIKSLRLFLL